MAKRSTSSRPALGTVAKTRSAAPRRRPMKDVALILGPTADAKGFHVLRKREGVDEPEFGSIVPVEAGKPIHSDVVSLKARTDVPFLFDMKTEVSVGEETERPTSAGPAQVSTPQYRSGWERIYGQKSGRNAVSN